MEIKEKTKTIENIARSDGLPHLWVKLGDKIIEKHIAIRNAVPEDGKLEKPVPYAAFLDYSDKPSCFSAIVPEGIHAIRKKLSLLLASKIADEINLFNSVMNEIDNSIDQFSVSDLPLMLKDGIGLNGECIQIIFNYTKSDLGE